MDINLEIGIQCTCGASLDVEETKAKPGEVTRFKVKPCQDCIDLAIEEAANKELVTS